jgi:tetratricopeptide (TPR) repeat protein
MIASKQDDQINALFRSGKWQRARAILEAERERDPSSHWVLTQLGVTFYEQRRYREALELFRASLEIVPDCPLTLWNVAGALDALGKSGEAIDIYKWLIESKTTPKQDPCWESEDWSLSLKTDCFFRLGTCFQRLRKQEKAQECFEEYLHLLSIGAHGSYSLEEVQKKMRALLDGSKPADAKRAIRKAINATFGSSTKVKRGDFQTQKVGGQLRGRRVASRKK